MFIQLPRILNAPIRRWMPCKSESLVPVIHGHHAALKVRSHGKIPMKSINLYVKKKQYADWVINNYHVVLRELNPLDKAPLRSNLIKFLKWVFPRGFYAKILKKPPRWGLQFAFWLGPSVLLSANGYLAQLSPTLTFP